MTDKTEGLEVVATVQRHPRGATRIVFPDSIVDCDAQWQTTRSLCDIASAQAAVAAREKYHNAYVEGVLESYAEFGKRIAALESALGVAREALEIECGGRCNAEYNPCWARGTINTIDTTLEPEK